MKGKQFRVKEKSRAAELRETMFASNLVGTLCVCVCAKFHHVPPLKRFVIAFPLLTPLNHLFLHANQRLHKNYFTPVRDMILKTM